MVHVQHHAGSAWFPVYGATLSLNYCVPRPDKEWCTAECLSSPTPERRTDTGLWDSWFQTAEKKSMTDIFLVLFEILIWRKSWNLGRQPVLDVPCLCLTTAGLASASLWPWKEFSEYRRSMEEFLCQKTTRFSPVQLIPYLYQFAHTVRSDNFHHLTKALYFFTFKNISFH